MTRDDIIRMAREAGIEFSKWGTCYTGNTRIERFAELVAAAEREACASFIKNWKYAKECASCDQPTPDQYAAAIRARGEP